MAMSTSRANGTSERVLNAAAQALRIDPTSSMEVIASAAGLSRATIHRRFPTRANLMDALRERAITTVTGAFNDEQPDEPPVVRLYSVTRRLLAAKVDWSWILSSAGAPRPEHNPILAAAIDWMSYIQANEFLADDADLDWAATVYLTIVTASAMTIAESDSLTMRSTRALDAFLHGFGQSAVRYTRL